MSVHDNNPQEPYLSPADAPAAAAAAAGPGNASLEQQLAELQARGRGSGFFSGDLGAELNDDERSAIERFRARVTQVRGELRGVERDLRSDIDQLKTAIVFVNLWLAPMLVAGAGVFLFWRRQRRAKAGLRSDRAASPAQAEARR